MARRVIYALWSQIEGEGNGLVSAAALVSAQDKSSWIAYASPCQSDESGPRAFLRERTLASHGSSSAEPTHRPHRGILILLMPRILNYVVAIYLIAIGIIGLAHHFQ